MKLNELLNPWININTNTEIKGLHNNSRLIEPGFLFCALKGSRTDGRHYIKDAIEAGAAAILYDPEDCAYKLELQDKIPHIALPSLNHMLPEIAARFYGEPSKKMTLTGITGTNGKTSIAYQLAQAHEKLLRSSAYIGTLGQGPVTCLESTDNTTPDAVCLQKLLHHYQLKGIQEVCMEVSSHALDQHRVDCIDFKQAIFTNMTQDHLDYHLNMQAYAKAKSLLFAWPSLQCAIINADDAYAKEMIDACLPSCEILRYGIKKDCDVRVLNSETSMYGTRMELHSPWGRLALEIKAPGDFNIYNALAIFTSLMAASYPLDTVISLMKTLEAAPGRLEVIHQNPYVIVDYAHTPDALEQVLLTLERLKKGRILVVFGCGGDRDKTKRPIMGRIADHYADIVILTNDNPRTEDPLQIIDDIKAGLKLNNLYIIPDREEAISKAISLANQEDIVLVAGKGHETYQQIGQERFLFSDREIIKVKLTM